MTDEDTLEPTEQGFYKYTGDRQTLLFLRDAHHRRARLLGGHATGQWYAIFDNGSMGQCVWGYVEQALT